MYKAIIFDMDGVLTDTVPLNMKARQQVCQSLGVQMTAEDFPHMTGVTDSYAFHYLMTKYELSPSIEELVSKKIAFFLNIVQREGRLFSGTIDLLKQLKHLKYTMALTTSSLKAQQEQLFQRFQLSQYFDLVVTGEDITKSKPDPEPYLYTLERLKLKAENTLVIEDAINGVLSAKRAGCKVIAVTHTHNREELESVRPDYIVDRLDKVIAIIRSG